MVGGGFAGLAMVRALARTEVDVTLLDRTNHHLFQPLLYQVATGGLSSPNIAAPLRHILRRQHGARVLMAEARDFDLERRRVLLDRGALAYDTLALAAGARTHWFGRTDWERDAPGYWSTWCGS